LQSFAKLLRDELAEAIDPPKVVRARRAKKKPRAKG